MNMGVKYTLTLFIGISVIMLIILWWSSGYDLLNIRFVTDEQLFDNNKSTVDVVSTSKITVIHPKVYEMIYSPYEIRGSVVKDWYNYDIFPIFLYDNTGTLLTATWARAIINIGTDIQSSQKIPFTAKLEFDQFGTNEGFLRFINASNDQDSIIVPVRLSPIGVPRDFY